MRTGASGLPGDTGAGTSWPVVLTACSGKEHKLQEGTDAQTPLWKSMAFATWKMGPGSPC